jgi:hypothetical protein
MTFPRETIHFSFNGPVGGHMYGNWDDTKFAILVPVPSIIDRIVNISPQDAFILGELKLPKGSEIVGRSKDMSGKDFGNAKPIFIDDTEKPHEAAIKRIKEKGYVPMRIGMWSWVRPVHDSDADEMIAFFDICVSDSWAWTASFSELAKKLGKDFGSHTDTTFGQIERTSHYLIGMMIDAMKTRPTKRECRELIKRADETLEDLKKVEHQFNSSAEGKEAYKRMIDEYSKIGKFFKDILKSARPEPEEPEQHQQL